MLMCEWVGRGGGPETRSEERPLREPSAWRALQSEVCQTQLETWSETSNNKAGFYAAAVTKKQQQQQQKQAVSVMLLLIWKRFFCGNMTGS